MQILLMVTVKSEICFDSDQFVGGAKNLRDQCAIVIYPPKTLSLCLTLLLNFGKILDAFNCLEIYAIS